MSKLITLSNFWKNWRNIYSIFRDILQLLNNARMAINPKEWSLFSKIVDCWGYTIASGKLHVATKTIDAIEALRYLATVSELRPFLRVCNVYRRFVPNFAEMGAPLNKKLKNGETKQSSFDEDKMKAVDVVKVKLITPPVLALPKPNRQHIINTDICGTQPGCVLRQEQEDKGLKPIDYWSWLICDANRWYYTTYK